MATVRCERGHLYDDRRYTLCPHCPTVGLKGATVPRTEAAPMSRPAVAPTEAVSGLRSTTPYRAPSGLGATEAASVRATSAPPRGTVGAAGVTVGAFSKRTAFDPVVGWLVCIKGINKGRDYRLHSDLNKVGRAPSMDVCIEGDDTISRENHCQIAFSPRSKMFSVIPGGGRNLIYLNGKDVLTATGLEAFDCLDIGDGSFLFIPFCSDRFDWDRAPSRREPQPQETETQEVVERPRPGEPEPPVC